MVATTIIGLAIGCNDADPKQQSPDTGTDDTDHTGDVDDADVPQWPGQDIRESPLGVDWDMPEADDGFRVLVANIGNVDIHRCANVDYNMCWTEQEEIVAGEIALRDPDIILLQEVLVPEQCDGIADSVGEDHACHPDHRPDEPEQVRRLVGDGYTISCDSRFGYECVAARATEGFAIQGCDTGDLCRDHARTGDVVDGCDPGFSVSAVTVEVDGQPIDFVNVHPPSDMASNAAECRYEMFQDFFGEDAPLIENDAVFVGGDFNFDPYRASANDPDVALWHDHVFYSYDDTHDDTLSFAYHSGIVEHDPPYYTSPIINRTLDHAISNSLTGRCITLGAHPGEAPLDHLHGNMADRLDHMALDCVLQ